MDDPLLVGCDAGGTFTDFAVLDGDCWRFHKELSTPDDPARAILAGLEKLGVTAKPNGRRLLLVHGTTVATNAVLEGKGARVAFITNEGFTDLLTLGRGERPLVYTLQQPAPPCPVAAECCIGISGRLDADGEELEPLDLAQLAGLPERLRALGIQSVAICLLHGFAHSSHEQGLEQALADQDSGGGNEWFVCRSSGVLPEIGEYERGIATWLNAATAPLIGRYLEKLQTALPAARIQVMQSSATTIHAAQAASQAVRLLLSGPAGGLAAASALGAQMSTDQRERRAGRLLTFDMGGTSTDVALVDGEVQLTREGRIAGYPVSVPMVAMHTIGAGGGSLAWVDAGGVLQVGPESAGAMPGPACYGLGGERATVTDAHVVLGRLPADTLLGGHMPLDGDAADKAMDELARAMASNEPCSRLEAARGVVRMANEHMARALRVISVEQGHDPAEFSLLGFGGAGGLHLCELAELLGMSNALLPAGSGILSALGMLVARPGRILTSPILATTDQLTDTRVLEGFEHLEQEARAALLDEGVDPDQLQYQRVLEMRYRGQQHCLDVNWPAKASQDSDSLAKQATRFAEKHQAQYGHTLDLPMELVNLRLACFGPAPALALPPATPGDARQYSAPMAELQQQVPVIQRQGLTPGQSITAPAIIRDAAATLWLKPGWQATVSDGGHLLLKRT